jgi:hypothetical protein
MKRRQLVHLEDLLGRRVETENGALVGRIEEVRAERRGNDYEVTEFLLGSGALVERLSIVTRVFGSRPRTLVARWDQIDISRPTAPRLTCAIDDLKVEH